MEKPNRKDFSNNRNGRSRYLRALRKYELYTKRQQQKVKGDTSKLDVKKFGKGDPRTIEALKKRMGGPNKGKNIVLSSPNKPFDSLNKPITVKNDGPGRTKQTTLKPDSEAKQDLKDQKSKAFGGKLPQGSGIVKKTPKKVNKVDPKQFDNRKLKISNEAKQDLKDQSSDKFGGKLPKQKLKIKPSEEAKQDLKDQASDKFGGKLPNKKKVEKKEVKKNPLDKYRRTKGEGIEGKSKGYRGDTKITKNLKKAGFTETRLAKLRKKNAAFQKAKKGGKKAMAEYRKKYPKRG